MPAIQCRRDAGASILRDECAGRPRSCDRRAQSRGEMHGHLPCDISNRGGGRCGLACYLGFDAWGLLPRACPAGWLSWGVTGSSASSPSRSSGTAASQAIDGLTVPFGLPWTGCSRDHDDAFPNVMLRARALSLCEIAVPVTPFTMMMVPPPVIPASAPEAPAGFRGHLVANGRGCRRGVLVL